MSDRPISRGAGLEPEAFMKMGCALMGSGEGAKAVAFVEAILSRSNDPGLASAAQVILSHRVPHWHGPMLADGERNVLFERAISQAVRSGGTVLDIGAGSGLLSLMAARAGATDVVACEADMALAATAKEIVEANGYSDVIRVLPKRSTDLSRESDLLGGADVIVAEVFSDDLINEGALTTLEHAAIALGKPNARIIPAAASIQVALAYREMKPMDLASVGGFDLSPFEKHLLPDRKIQCSDPTLAFKSEPKTLFNFDFQNGRSFSSERTHVTLVANGPANGAVRWIRLKLDEENVYENAPGAGKHSHWAALFWPFPKGPVKDGDSVELHAAHDKDLVTLWVP